MGNATSRDNEFSRTFLKQVVDIAEKRSHILSQMKLALLSGQYERAIELARELTGVRNEKRD